MIKELRANIEKFNQEISKESYLQGAGLKDDIKFEEIYKKYPAIYDKNNIEELNSALKSTENSDEQRRYKILLENLYNEIIASELTRQSEQLMKTETEGIINAAGKDMSFRSSMIEMINNEDKSIRQEISDKRDEFTEAKLNPVLRDSHIKERERIQKFGFKNKIDMFQTLSSIDLYALNTEMRGFLSLTEDMYSDLLKYFAKKELGTDISTLKKHDLSHLMRGKNFDRFFPDKNLIPLISNFVSKMGLDISAGNNIIFDIENRENKSPRAFCSPVRIPNEVYLVLSPRGGQDDYSTFLHELGHALHYANVESTIPLEYKWYGDNSVTEGYAMSFDHLTLNPLWMDKVLGVNYNIHKDYYIFRNFIELVMLRRYAAKIDYEIKLAESDSLDKMPEVYRETLTEACKAEYTKASYLTDVDHYFYVARYLRAWMMQSNLHKCMREKFNEDWFFNPSSGSFLKELWSIGQKYNADELLEQTKCPSLSAKPLFEQINNVINN